MTNKNLLFSLAILLLAGATSFSQTKSIAEVQTEIDSFNDPAAFSVIYNDPKDITTLSLKADVRENDKNLEKKFKEFYFEMISIYSGIGVDKKPFRNLLCINSRANRFYFASDNDLVIGIENETIKFVSPDRTTEAKGRKIREKLCWDIDVELIRDLGRSSSLFLTVGSQKLSISNEKLGLLNSFSKLISIEETANSSQ